MAKLICEDCGEVLEKGLDPDEANEKADELDAHDHRDDPAEDQSDDESDDGLDDRTDIEEMEDDLQQEFEDKLDDVQDDNTEETEQDVEEYEDAAQDTNLDELSVEVGKFFDVDEARWNDVTSSSEAISSIFLDKLRQKRRSRTVRAQTSGTFDSGRMIAADRGSARVFKQDKEGDEAEYEAYFVLDRSGSMDQIATPTLMGDAEEATATLMKALEDAGVKTELLDFHREIPRLIKTRSQNIEDEKGNVLRGPNHADGGTPLGEVLQLLPDRISAQDGQPFVVVVTDGEPDSQRTYRDAIEQLNAEGVSVLGVMVGGTGRLTRDKLNSLFNSYAVVEDSSEITPALKDLARGVMF